MRSGLAALSAATWLVRSMVPTLGHCSVTTWWSMLNRFKIATNAEEDVSSCRFKSGNRNKLALPVFNREQRGHNRLAFVVG